jgi:hypothetical protein
MKRFIPETPGGTLLVHLEADSEEEAWANLVEDAAFMRYGSRKIMYARGYRVIDMEPEDEA